MIKVNAIKLPEAFDIYKNTKQEKAEFLEPVSKINIFVGSNNSGKSRFMRELSLQNCYEIKIEDSNLKKSNSIIKNSIERIKTLLDNSSLSKVNELSINRLDNINSSLTEILDLGVDKYAQIRKDFLGWATYTNITSWTGHGNPQYNNSFIEVIQKESQKVLSALNEIPVFSESNKPEKVYIPTLRGLRPLDEAHTDYYLERTRKDYFTNQLSGDSKQLEIERKHPEIFTGLSFYNRLTDLLLGNTQERKLIAKYQHLISKNLFENKTVDLIPNQTDKVVIVRIGNEKEQPIHHLGDGIQSAVILSFLPFVTKEQTFFFIEEPEMYLHPGLQRKILNFYNSLERHTFFLTTHSNHFLDITIDIKNASIFTFGKILDDSGGEELTPNFTIEAVDSGHESSLELLGVRNSSVFLVNATIWVEGITDRWYLRKMLNSYMDYLEETDEIGLRLEEDSHYSFVEYGGANITHWSFLDYEDHPIEVERLCAKAIVVIDGDGEKKMRRKEDLERILKDRLIILPCREVENLLPYKIIKEIVIEFEEKNLDLKLKDYSYDKYQNEYLGTFIESTMLKSNIKRRGGYREKPPKTGTLKGKLDFCEKALPKIKYEELPDSTKEIIQNIYQFIYERNS